MLKLQMQQVLRRAFMIFTAAAMAIEEVVVVAEEGEEGMPIAQERMPAAAVAKGACTAEWTTTSLGAAGSIVRHGAVAPLRLTTPNLRATTVVCPVILGPHPHEACSGAAKQSQEIGIGNCGDRNR